MVFPSDHLKLSASRNSISYRIVRARWKSAKPGWNYIVNVREVHLHQLSLLPSFGVFGPMCCRPWAFRALLFFKS